jgi:capsular exopolysaccharide synthesis family protein
MQAYVPPKSPSLEVAPVPTHTQSWIGGRVRSAIPVEDSTALDLAEFIRRHYRLFLATTLLGLIVAYAITKSQPAVYRAATSIEIQDFNENFLNLKEVSPFSAPPQSSSTNDLQTQVRILESSSLIERVLNQLPPEKTQPPAGLRAWALRLLGSRTAPVSHDDLIDNAARNLAVRQSPQARIVDVTYDSEDASYAAAFVNRLTQQYIDQSVESRLEISKGTTALLGRQLGDLRKQLEESEKRLTEYAHASGLLAADGEHRPAEDQLRQIQENLSKAQENRIIRQARMETAVQTPVEAVEAPVGSTLRDYQSKLTDLRRQRADLVAVYTPDFDGVKRLDGQIHALESALRSENAAILQGIQSDYNDSLRREKLLENSYLQQIGRVSAQAESTIQYGILKREVDTNREVYNNMLQRAAEARVASAMRASNARMVDPAKTPRLPYKPNAVLNLLWGGTAGLLFGLLLGTGRERYDRRIKSPGDLGVHLSVPELGVVPKISALSPGPSTALWLSPRGAERKDPSDEIALATWNRCKSPVADAFRGIVTSIVFSNELGRTPQVIAVTSALPGEGKTTMITNIAAVLAHVRRKVLLIDGDLREPRLHHIFNQVNNYGFADLLTLPGDNSDLLSYVTRQTPLPNVWLTTPGPQESGALELLYSNGMAGLMARARAEFDMILIDTPSMRDVPDARILGRISDGVILVVKSGATERTAAQAATARLQQGGIPVLGTVLNHWVP